MDHTGSAGRSERRLEYDCTKYQRHDEESTTGSQALAGIAEHLATTKLMEAEMNDLDIIPWGILMRLS